MGNIPDVVPYLGVLAFAIIALIIARRSISWFRVIESKKKIPPR